MHSEVYSQLNIIAWSQEELTLISCEGHVAKDYYMKSSYAQGRGRDMYTLQVLAIEKSI